MCIHTLVTPLTVDGDGARAREPQQPETSRLCYGATRHESWPIRTRLVLCAKVGVVTRTLTKTPVLSVDLDEYSANINEAVGRDLGYAPAVRELRAVRYSIKELDTALTAFKVALIDYHQARPQQTVEDPTNRGQWRWVRAGRSTQIVVPPPAVSSERAKEHGLWERGRAPVTYVNTTHSYAPNELLVGLPVVGEIHRRFDIETMRYERYRSEVASGLKAREAELRDTILAVRDAVADHGWDGSMVMLRDGWQVGFPTRQVYGSATLKANEPEQWEDLAVAGEPYERTSEFFWTKAMTDEEYRDWTAVNGE